MLKLPRLFVVVLANPFDVPRPKAPTSESRMEEFEIGWRPPITVALNIGLGADVIDGLLLAQPATMKTVAHVMLKKGSLNIEHLKQ